MKVERRKEARAPIVFVDYFPEGLPSLKISTFSKNISASGICILLAEDLEIDAALSLVIHLADGGKPIEVKASVRWTHPSSFLKTRARNLFEAGLVYLHIDNSDQARILGYVVGTLRP